ncbi:MAG TPA: HNH endonuclease signature motif containing protein [Ktedonobacterales bacterium]
MSDEVSAALRREIRERAGGCCEYCFMPDDEPLYPHEPDHIIALKHRGQTTSENLAYACFECNRAKGSNIASLDPATDALTPLFNPRTQIWAEHFHFNGPVIEPLTAVARVTAFLLRFNAPSRVAIRARLLAEGRYWHP